jgi:hypothetical protein
MTTTIIKTKTPSSSMKYITGMESITLKMVSILFIVILNVTSLSSQTVASYNEILMGSSVLPAQQKDLKFNLVHPAKVYTVYFAKNFPALESTVKTALHPMDDAEHFDYDEILCSVAPVQKNKTGLNPVPYIKSKHYKRNQIN